MLGKKGPQGRFFDHYVYENHLPRDHELVWINKEVDFSFVEAETRDLYEEDFGRPSCLCAVALRRASVASRDAVSDALFGILRQSFRCSGFGAVCLQSALSLVCGVGSG